MAINKHLERARSRLSFLLALLLTIRPEYKNKVRLWILSRASLKRDFSPFLWKRLWIVQKAGTDWGDFLWISCELCVSFTRLFYVKTGVHGLRSGKIGDCLWKIPIHKGNVEWLHGFCKIFLISQWLAGICVCSTKCRTSLSTDVDKGGWLTVDCGENFSRGKIEVLWILRLFALES